MNSPNITYTQSSPTGNCFRIYKNGRSFAIVEREGAARWLIELTENHYRTSGLKTMPRWIIELAFVESAGF